MLIKVSGDRRIEWYNDSISREESEVYISEGCIWADELIIAPEHREGYSVEMYLNSDNTVRYEYTAKEEEKREPTNSEISENQTIIMLALADLYEAVAAAGEGGAV